MKNNFGEGGAKTTVEEILSQNINCFNVIHKTQIHPLEDAKVDLLHNFYPRKVTKRRKIVSKYKDISRVWASKRKSFKIYSRNKEKNRNKINDLQLINSSKPKKHKEKKEKPLRMTWPSWSNNFRMYIGDRSKEVNFFILLLDKGIHRIQHDQQLCSLKLWFKTVQNITKQNKIFIKDIIRLCLNRSYKLASQNINRAITKNFALFKSELLLKICVKQVCVKQFFIALVCAQLEDHLIKWGSLKYIQHCISLCYLAKFKRLVLKYSTKCIEDHKTLARQNNATLIQRIFRGYVVREVVKIYKMRLTRAKRLFSSTKMVKLGAQNFLKSKLKNKVHYLKSTRKNICEASQSLKLPAYDQTFTGKNILVGTTNQKINPRKWSKRKEYSWIIIRLLKHAILIQMLKRKMAVQNHISAISYLLKRVRRIEKFKLLLRNKLIDNNIIINDSFIWNSTTKLSSKYKNSHMAFRKTISIDFACIESDSCANCRTNIKETYCLDCNSAFCHQCHKTVHSFKSLKSHKSPFLYSICKRCKYNIANVHCQVCKYDYCTYCFQKFHGKNQVFAWHDVENLFQYCSCYYCDTRALYSVQINGDQYNMCVECFKNNKDPSILQSVTILKVEPVALHILQEKHRIEAEMEVAKREFQEREYRRLETLKSAIAVKIQAIFRGRKQRTKFEP